MKLSKKKLQELKDKKISIENLDDRCFIESLYEVEVDNIKKLLTTDICDFKEIVDKFKSMEDPDDDNNSCLYRLLDKEFFEELIKNKLNKEDLRYLLNRLDNKYELDCLSENTSLLNYIVDKGLFKELVDTFKSIKDVDDGPCLRRLLNNKELFEELIQNNKLTKEDLRYLLDKIDRSYELPQLCRNTSLIKKILKELVLDTELVDRFNSMLEGHNHWCKIRNVHTVFDMIEYWNKDYKELLKLNELNKKVYMLNSFDLTKDQKLELIDVLKDNESAQSLLKQLVENHLQDQYSFETLKKMLTKDNEKKKIKMNF